jgi:hypothetical protein
MRQMPDLNDLQNCGDLTDGEITEKSAFSFANPPIATLPFAPPEGLTWENFERLCCRLMAKLYNLHGYSRYGSGRNQQGIDIIGYRPDSLDSLMVIQCKRVVEFDRTKFNNAVKEFKEGRFYRQATEFVMLTACQLLPEPVEQEVI